MDIEDSYSYNRYRNTILNLLEVSLIPIATKQECPPVRMYKSKDFRTALTAAGSTQDPHEKLSFIAKKNELQ